MSAVIVGVVLGYYWTIDQYGLVVVMSALCCLEGNFLCAKNKLWTLTSLSLLFDNRPVTIIESILRNIKPLSYIMGNKNNTVLKMKKATFTRKPKKNITHAISGTLTSTHNGLLLVSTGVPSLDSVLGGGLPVGSVLLVEEDKHTRFSTLLAKYFIAEGLLCNNGINFTSLKHLPETSLTSLPKPLEHSNVNKISKPITNPDMKIAFRYKDLPKNENSLSNVQKFGHYYDISETMNEEALQNCDVKTLNYETLISLCDPNCNDFIFRSILHQLKTHAENTIYHVPQAIDSDTKLNILRVVISDFASPLFCNNTNESVAKIARFFHCIRALARKTLMTVMISFPAHLYKKAQVHVVRQMVDCSVELHSFDGERKNPLFKQYHGLFKIHKLPCLNSINSYVPSSFDLAFELKRTKFVIEYLHLPPDLAENVNSGRTDEAMSCGENNSNSKLDF